MRRTCGRTDRPGRSLPALAALLAALGAASCGSGFTREQACQMVKDHLKQKAGWQLHDAYRVPAVVYRNVDVIECYDFESSAERGWARIHVRARGDQYEAEGEKLLGRTEFEPTFEFDRFDQGWKIVE